jgi:hypothetical protein
VLVLATRAAVTGVVAAEVTAGHRVQGSLLDATLHHLAPPRLGDSRVPACQPGPGRWQKRGLPMARMDALVSEVRRLQEQSNRIRIVVGPISETPSEPRRCGPSEIEDFGGWRRARLRLERHVSDETVTALLERRVSSNVS